MRKRETDLFSNLTKITHRLHIYVLKKESEWEADGNKLDFRLVQWIPLFYCTYNN